MKLSLIETKEISEFEREIGYELEVIERDKNNDCQDLKKFYASFIGGESMEGGCLITHTGNGNTVDEAIKDYCHIISCRKMAFGAYSDKRKEIQFPKLIHTKLYGF